MDVLIPILAAFLVFVAFAALVIAVRSQGEENRAPPRTPRSVVEASSEPLGDGGERVTCSYVICEGELHCPRCLRPMGVTLDRATTIERLICFRCNTPAIDRRIYSHHRGSTA